MADPRRTALCALAFMGVLAGVLAANPTRAATPEVDVAVRPGDDFNAYANGPWIRATPLPEGLAIYGPTSMLRAENARRVSALVEAAAKSPLPKPGSPKVATQKIGDYYASWMDTAAIDAKGLAPISRDLAAIAAIGDRRQLSAALGRTLRLDDGTNTSTDGLLGVWVHQDFHHPDHYAAHLVQSGLGLDEPDDYLNAAKAHRRALYRAHVAAILRLARLSDPDARATRVLALEVAIARTHASRADTNDVFKTDNPWRRADFAAKAPGMDWAAWFQGAGLEKQIGFVVWQPAALTGAAALVAVQPLEAWKDYLTFHRLEHDAAVLPKAFGEEDAAFAGRLSGAPPRASDRTQQALAATDAALGDAIGRLYVARYSSPETKAAAVAMAENIRIAFRARITGAAWMSAPTQGRALAKLATVVVGLGYPDSWVDYAALSVVRGDALGNLRRAEAFEYRRQIARLGRPVDPDEWGIRAQSVNAFLFLSPNTLQFSQGLLQPPLFDAAGDPAANYGSAGAGMAHEISHSFDEVGNIYDPQGRLGMWWTPDDLKRYRAAAAPLIAQYAAYCPRPGLCLKGEQVFSESSADLVGLTVAHDAYLLSLQGRPDTVKDGLSGEQRFFLAFAARWRTVRTEAALRQQVQGDTHPPGEYRADTVRNLDAWYAAFDVRPGDKLYLKSEDRVRIW